MALALAIRTASAATRSASAVERSWLAANPHAPPTITRTPNPSLSPPATPSTRAGLDGDRLLEPPDHAHVGVRGAQRGGRVEGTAGRDRARGRGYTRVRPDDDARAMGPMPPRAATRSSRRRPADAPPRRVDRTVGYVRPARGPRRPCGAWTRGPEIGQPDDHRPPRAWSNADRAAGPLRTRDQGPCRRHARGGEDDGRSPEGSP